MKIYYFKLFIDDKQVYSSERSSKPFNKNNINFEIGEDKIKTKGGISMSYIKQQHDERLKNLINKLANKGSETRHA